MQNSAVKTFHFRPSSQQVLGHLLRCEVCLSRVTGALEGIVGLDALALIGHVRGCLASSLGQSDAWTWRWR